MKIAMLGLQGAGKKTLFKLTTGTSVTSVPPKGVPGMFEVKDPRVGALSALYHPERTIYARIDVVLLPDVEKTQGKAAWLGGVIRCNSVWICPICSRRIAEQRKQELALERGGKQEATILVKGAYNPSIVKVKAGMPVLLHFVRQEDTSCSRFVTFDGLKIRKDLKAFAMTDVEFIPKKTGEVPFSCDMGMYHGKIIIE